MAVILVRPTPITTGIRAASKNPNIIIVSTSAGCLQ
jgi:hypothetical protein